MELNTTFDQATVNQYPSVQKYYSKTNKMSDSTAYSVITEEIIKYLWSGLTYRKGTSKFTGFTRRTFIYHI
jgi:hypothetical protein